MRGRSYSYSPSPSRDYHRRHRSPSPRGHYGSRGRDLPTSLLVHNLRHDCRPEDLHGPFWQFGRLKDIYLPRDYYTGKKPSEMRARERMRGQPCRRFSPSYSRSPRYSQSYSCSPDYYSPPLHRHYSKVNFTQRWRYRGRSYSRSCYGSRSPSRSFSRSRSRSLDYSR